MGKSILLTGCNGLIGEQVVNGLLNKGYKVIGVDIEEPNIIQNIRFKYISADLTQTAEVYRLFNENDFSHVIHLAAIAHTTKGVNIEWSRYYRVNTMMSRQIFELASRDKIPVFFASTVDVYGIQNKEIDENAEPNPIGNYAKSKYIAECILKEVSNQSYLIARFAPVYTEKNLNDIHKRYYVSYPKISYLIGNGMDYEFLSSSAIIELVLKWINASEDICGIINVYDLERHNTKKMIWDDKQNGLANIVIRIPQWTVHGIIFVADIILRRRELLRLSVYKIIRPMQFDRSKLMSILQQSKQTHQI